MIILLPANVSAVPDYDWNSAVTATAPITGTAFTTDAEVAITNDATGTIYITSGTLKITGTASSHSGFIKVNLGPNATLDWQADVISTTALSIEGTGTVNFSSGSYVTTGSPAVSIDSAKEVNINGTAIEGKTSMGILTSADLTMNGGSVSAVHWGIDTNAVDLQIRIVGGNVISTASASDCAAIKLSDTGSVLTVEGGTITGGTGTNGILLNSGTSLVMTNGIVIGNVGITATSAASVRISGGSVSGTSKGISASAAGLMELSDGSITGTNNAAVDISGNTDLTISGATLVGNYFGISLASSSASLKMTSGYVSGNQAIGAIIAEKVEVSGGTVSGVNQGIYTYQTPTTISGGLISGDSALVIQGSTVTVTGGTFSGTGSLHKEGIYIDSGTLYITPNINTPIIVRGETTAINENSYTPTYNVLYSIASENYDGSNSTPTDHPAGLPFANSSSYKYIKFFAASPVVVVEKKSDPFVPALPEANSVPGRFDFSYNLTYLEKHSNRLGTSYVNMDFSLTPNIRGNLVEDKTAVSALRAAVRLAREAHQTEIFINVPEGTEFSDKFTLIKKILAIRYKMKITVKFAE
jgi:hypothetical protein